MLAETFTKCNSPHARQYIAFWQERRNLRHTAPHKRKNQTWQAANNLRKIYGIFPFFFAFARPSPWLPPCIGHGDAQCFYLRMFEIFSVANSEAFCTQRFKRNPEASFTTCCQFSSSWCRPHSLNPVRVSRNMQICYGPQGTWEKIQYSIIIVQSCFRPSESETTVL